MRMPDLLVSPNQPSPDGEDISPFFDWKSSVMANAFTDPYFRATMKHETEAFPHLAGFIEDTCLTCHTPMARAHAHQTGVSLEKDASCGHDKGCYRADQAMADPHAREGISCTACHQITDSQWSPRSTIRTFVRHLLRQSTVSIPGLQSSGGLPAGTRQKQKYWRLQVFRLTEVSMSKDYFAHKAHTYEQNPDRVDNVSNIANAILGKVKLEPSMHLLDFGSGTGLLLERIAHHVGKITAVDISPSMNRQLLEKQGSLACELEVQELDLEKQTVEHRFDGIISSMTMHHVRDVDAMFCRFHEMVKPGGFIAIADLDKEDGSFHTEDTGVFHFGFDREDIVSAATQAGFENVEVVSASTIKRETGDYPVFLLVAWRHV